MIIGLLFYFSFASKFSFNIEEEKSEIEDRQLITNLIDTMLFTNLGVECQDETMKTLVKDCVDNIESNGEIICYGMKSCDFLDDKIDKQFLKPVLGIKDKDYIFNLTNMDNNMNIINIVSGDNCYKKRLDFTSTLPFPITGNVKNAQLRLMICN